MSIEWPEKVVKRVAEAIKTSGPVIPAMESVDTLAVGLARAALDALGGERVSALYSDDTGEFLVAGPLHEENKFMVPAVLIKLGGEL